MTQANLEWAVEPAIPEAAGELAEVHAKSFRAAYLGHDPLTDPDVLAEALAFVSPKRIEQRQELITYSLENSDKHFYYQAVDGDLKPIGFVYGSKLDGVQELEALYVDPALLRSGIGSELVDAFVAWCDPAQDIELGVVKYNLRAQRFYVSMGFVALGDTRQSYYSFLPETTMILPAGGKQ